MMLRGDGVMGRIVLFIAAMLSVAAMSADVARAQCYPGLACPPTATPQNAPEPQPAIPATIAPSPLVGGSEAGQQASAAAVAPSFTCKDSKSAAELTICQNQDLAVLDLRLSATYGGVQSRMNAAELKALRDQQRNWVKERDKCGGDAGCIKRLYVSRLEQLSAR